MSSGSSTSRERAVAGATTDKAFSLRDADAALWSTACAGAPFEGFASEGARTGRAGGSLGSGTLARVAKRVSALVDTDGVEPATTADATPAALDRRETSTGDAEE